MSSRPSVSSAPSSTLFWYQVVSLLALIVMIAGVGGLSLVWLRQQMTDTASRIQVVQRERVQVERRLEFLGARIAELQRPDVLRERARSMGLALVRPQGRQIVRLGPLPVSPGGSDPSGDPAPGREPFRQTFDLAVMEPLGASGR
jgi:hypothetical protein